MSNLMSVRKEKAMQFIQDMDTHRKKVCEENERLLKTVISLRAELDKLQRKEGLNGKATTGI